MKYLRWYDKNPDLHSFMSLLESLDEYSLCLLAQEFIQVIMEKYAVQADIFIQQLNNNPPPNYNRWYDKNYDLHTSIEFLKTIPETEQQELINDFKNVFFHFITEHKNV